MELPELLSWPEPCEPLVPQYDAILMANHGVVTYGSDLQSAYMKMETVEHFAQIALVTHILGRQQLLDGDELEKLIAARSKYLGVNSAAPMPVHFVERRPERLMPSAIQQVKDAAHSASALFSANPKSYPRSKINPQRGISDYFFVGAIRADSPHSHMPSCAKSRSYHPPAFTRTYPGV